MMKVYQIVFTKEETDGINHGESCAKYDLKRDMMWGDDFSAINSSTMEHFTLVAEVDTVNMEKAFELMNLWNDMSRVHMFERCHSMSVGDLIEHENGRTFVVAGEGFVEIFNNEVA